MDWDSIVKIGFGALLGVLITLVHEWLGRHRESRDTELVVLAEVRAVLKALQPFSSSDNKSYPVTEIPNLSALGVRGLALLPPRAAELSLQAQNAIRYVNELRLLAIAASREGHVEEKNAYSVGCVHWLSNALVAAQELEAILARS